MEDAQVLVCFVSLKAKKLPVSAACPVRLGQSLRGQPALPHGIGKHACCERGGGRCGPPLGASQLAQGRLRGPRFGTFNVLPEV